MLTALLCVTLGTAYAGSASDLRNEWSGEYDMPGNLTIMVSPLRLGLLPPPRIGGFTQPETPMLDITAELRTGETRSFAITGATPLGGRSFGSTGIGGARAPMELGVQLRDYIVGTFDNGLFIGGHLNFTNPDIRRFRADETTFGPMAGLKVTMSIFSVQARGGANIDLGAQGFRVEPMVDFATGLTF